MVTGAFSSNLYMRQCSLFSSNQGLTFTECRPRLQTAVFIQGFTKKKKEKKIPEEFQPSGYFFIGQNNSFEK